MTYTPTGDSEEFESENLDAIHQQNLEEVADFRRGCKYGTR